MAKRATKDTVDPSDGLANELTKFNEHRLKLSRILGDTQKALSDVTHLKIIPLESAIAETIRVSAEGAIRPSAFVIFGTARARLANFLLGENILPLDSQSSSSGWRWIRLQYGPKRQVRLSLGTEFEIVDPNISMESNWHQIPSQSLRRSNTSDLSTVLNIELTNQFLKSGIQILIPPDLGELSLNHKASYECSPEAVMRDYESFYSKWNSLLENVFPIVLYSLDELPSIKCVEVDEKSPQKSSSPQKSDEKSSARASSRERVKTSTFYIDSVELNADVKNAQSVDTIFEVDDDEIRKLEVKSDHNIGDTKMNTQDLPLLGEENLLDLRQIYDLHPNTKVLFVLFSDSTEKSLDKKVVPNFNVLNANDSIKFYLKDSVDTASPSSFFSCENLSFSSTPSSTHGDMNASCEDYETTSEDTLNGTEMTEKVEQLKLNDDPLFLKQKAFLDKVVQQLELLPIPFLKKSPIGQGVIINDALQYQLQSSTAKSDSKKIKTNKSNSTETTLNRNEFIRFLVKFAKSCFQNFVLDDCHKLSEIHHTLLQQFILTSFDMAREMQIIPRKITYVAKMEQKLYTTLYNKFSDGEKREELLSIMQNVLQDMKTSIISLDWAGSGSSCHNSTECINLSRPSSIFYTENLLDCVPNTSFLLDESQLVGSVTCESDSVDLNDYDVVTSSPSNANSSSAVRMDDVVEANEEAFLNIPVDNCSAGNDNRNLSGSVQVLDLRETHTFKNPRLNGSNSPISIKQASLGVQRAVLAKISRNISIQLVKFVDCLRDNYFGTLQRCLDSLEEGRGKRTASEAVRQILLVTRTIDLQHCASFSFLHALVDHLRRFFHRLSLLPNNNKSCCVQSARWRRQMALDTVESLSASRLENIISTQLKDKIRQAHDQFQSAVQSLNEHHTNRLLQTEEIKIIVRKRHAPRFARLCLESTSLGDFVRFGFPKLGKEIGRGQYGIVFSVKGPWGGYEPCAVKSVVPPDERHFNELAMEFFHTRNLPNHDRIVRLWGSVIDYSYRDGNPAVSLISERMKWDLHCALMLGNVMFPQRMQITIDIVEGIRYLHSQGLVHRDIKLKNVLLDEHNRAKLTDLGFCIPGAMMSGSIVGTPVHMAPDLLTGSYDNSVDVYAFGILFWYVCAGSVRLPAVFENFQNKEQLWINVKRGLRPERLPHFSDKCWSLMEKCWAAEPSQRPLLGDVQPILELVRDNPHSSAEYIY